MKFQKYAFPVSLLIIGFALWSVAVSSAATSFGQANVFSNFLDRIFKANPELQSLAPNDSSVSANAYESTNTYEDAVIRAVDRVSPSVVAITVSKNVPIIGNCKSSSLGTLPQGFEDFFGGSFEITIPCSTGKTQKQDVGGGSGFIVSSDGMILTNKHVVSDESASYTVLTNDGKKYDAKVLARDNIQDLAVLKIVATNLPVAPLGNSDTIRLAQTAITIGNALSEFRNTVSVGVVSGLARNVTAGSGGFSEELEGVIQTDAAINPGNSGGPLINLKGEVIGINTAIVSGAQNIGFALPINNAKRDIDSVKTTGKITIPFIGVRYLVVTPEVAKREKLSVEYGALVRGNDSGPATIKGSPAEKAGIQAEDVVIEVNGAKISEGRSLLSLIQRYNVGDTVNLKVLRVGKEIVVPVKLEERK